MIDVNELVRRAVTIRQSRIPDASIFDARFDGWYILGDVPPHFPVPALITEVFIDTDMVSIWVDHPEYDEYTQFFSEKPRD